jgi:dienelactone hydrolase
MRRHWRLILGVIAAVLLVIGVAGYVWLSDLADPMPEAEAAMVSSQAVSVTTEPWLTFTPLDPATTGFIIYPGGRVSPEAYAPPVRALAEAGYLGVITPMPFGLAVLDQNAADGVIEAHPDIERWVIGGHSLGGAMAAQYAAGHGEVDGLALWAAYPPDGTDLSASDALVTSISASEDGLATPAEIEASAAQLPADSTFVEIAGGNHAQFGWYGEQDGDGQATISREAQQEQVVSATLSLIEAVAAR